MVCVPSNTYLNLNKHINQFSYKGKLEKKRINKDQWNTMGKSMIPLISNYYDDSEEHLEDNNWKCLLTDN